MLKKTLTIFAILVFCQQSVDADDQNNCPTSGSLTFVCGLNNAEDLVSVPNTRWVLSSSMAPGGGIYLVDSVEKTWTQMYANTAQQVRHDAATYGACQGAPVLENFITHGLNIRQGDDGHSTLYVVGHGGREAIEVFDVDANHAKPLLIWIGCVPMPAGLGANSVASLSDGSLVATVLMHPGDTFADVFSGKPTGAIYKWSPGKSGFELIRGTELPGNNGIEVSLDEQEIFVVSTGLSTISVFSHSNPSTLLRSTRSLDFRPDNVHMTVDGQLLTAGPSNVDHECGELDPENTSIEEFASCPRGFVAATIDPISMVETKLVSGPANPAFSNATMALQVGDEVWIGSFSGDRIGVASPATIEGISCHNDEYHCPDKDCAAEIIAQRGNLTEILTGRNFFLDYPCDLKEGEDVLFVLNLHGGGSIGNWQRHYFPIMDFKDKYRLIVATPSGVVRAWVPENDDEHLKNIVDYVYRKFANINIKAFWLAGHSQGGQTANRLINADFFRDRLTGWVSIAGGRLGSERGEIRARIPREPPPGAAAERPGGPMRLVAYAENLPSYTFSHIYISGEYEIPVEKGLRLPENSAWAEKLGCGKRERRPDVVDTKAGYVYDSREQPNRSRIWGLDPGPGKAEVYVYPNCTNGHLVADIVRLGKGHTEGLEPNVTEEIVKLMILSK